MLSAFRIEIFLSTLLLFSAGCSRKESCPDARLLADSLLVSPDAFYKQTDSIVLQFSDVSGSAYDTMDCSKIASFIQHEIRHIPECRKPERILLLADFTYSFLSFEFLHGYNYRKNEINEQEWEEMSLAQQCAAESARITGFACGYRTDFFFKLLEELGYHEFFAASVPGKHTYPVVNAGTGSNPFWIIADPYDPFVFLDSVRRVMDVYSVLEQRSGRVYRTKRNFGPSKSLVKDSLLINAGYSDNPGMGLQKITEEINSALMRESGRTFGEHFCVDLQNISVLPPDGDFIFYLNEYGRADTFNLRNIFNSNSHYFSPDIIITLPEQQQSNARTKKAAETYESLCRNFFEK